MARSLSPAPDDIPFELPSFQFRGYAAYGVASAVIHSGRFNIRGREYHSYGFCALALQDLVSDLAPTALLIPQFEFDAFTITHPASISLIDSIASLPQPNTRGPVPDFVVVLVRAILTTTGMPIPRGIRLDSFEHWGKIKIENLIPGLVVEVKRRPTRSAQKAQDFQSSLTGHMNEARSDTTSQAAAGFLAHEGTDRFILLAWSGEWFSWTLAVREDFAITAMPLRQIVSEGDVGEVSEEDQEVSHSNTGPGSDDGNYASSDHEWETIMPWPTLSEPDTDNQNPPTLRPAGRGERTQPPRVSKSEAAKIQGFYAYQDPLVGVTDTKTPYNANPKVKGQKTEPPPQRKPSKATFRRYTPDDLSGIMVTQRLLTEAECKDADLFRDKWSAPMLFGTPESKQNLFLIHRFLERMTTRLSGKEDDGSENCLDLDDYSTEGSDCE